mmetsp:Transcript_65682/g.154549  ORF Transcript_65682/g.154549 Transcript_65682/m.154549 type:complete len:331 (-) Transcript_65682:6-998(-)
MAPRFFAVGWIAIVTACAVCAHFPAFSQLSTSVLRERSGRSISQPLPDSFKTNESLTTEEKRLCSRIAGLGKAGEWQRVSQLWRKYTGRAETVMTAAMQAAYRCGQYSEASRICNRMRNLQVEASPVTLLVQMKIFGKLKDEKRVSEIWTEMQGKGPLDIVRAGARVDAAAYMGDIPGAAAVLDTILNMSLAPDVPIFNSAINACTNAEPPSPGAAMLLYETMLGQDLQPTVVTFTNMARSHKQASVDKIKRVRSLMKKQAVQPDSVFAEVYLSSLFQVQNRKFLFDAVAGRKGFEERKQEARNALADFHRAAVRLTGLSRKIEKQLRDL